MKKSKIINTDTNLALYEWSITARYKIQLLMVKLYSKHKNYEIKKGNEWKIFSTLVSSTFSLWRAAFLIPSQKDYRQFREDTFKLLEKLIKDNSIAFSDDRKLQEWMSGYYLRNSYYRLNRIKNELNTTLDFKIDDYPKLHDFTNLLKTDPKTCWNNLYDCSEEIISKLFKNLSKGNYEYGLKPLKK